MDKFRIIGGKRLNGKIAVSGAKNSALPCMAATLLTPDTVTLHNVPHVRDLITMRHLLEDLGCTSLSSSNTTHNINASGVNKFEAPYDLVKTMRASVLVLGPLIARFGRACVSLPGGCAIGQRPVDMHMTALEKMGADIEIHNGLIEAKASRLKGTDIHFDIVTVTGSENIMTAAVLAEGVTTIHNAACEPEIVDLADLLTKMGADIAGAGTPTITIKGVDALHGTEHSIIPDRIEAGTFIIAAAITNGTLDITNCNPDHLAAVINKLRSVGVVIEHIEDKTIRAYSSGQLKAADLQTAVHPGFPTDMQAQYMALMTQADGPSVITETIFENRFMHASELLRLGAKVRVHGNTAIVNGPTQLTGASIIASDLRASASLVLAGLAAQDETIIDRVYHIDRGYEQIEEKLRNVGAQIERI